MRRNMSLLNRGLVSAVAITALIATSSTAVAGQAKALAAPTAESPTATTSKPVSMDVELTQTQYERLLSRGRRLQAEHKAGRASIPSAGPSRQQASRAGSTPVIRTKALRPAVAQQQARATATAAHARTARQTRPEAAFGDEVTTLDAQPALGTSPPSPQVEECFSNDDVVETEIGRVMNRWAYCQRHDVVVKYYVKYRGLPRIHVGDTRFTYELYGQGDEKTRRVRTFARVQKSSVQYDWLTEWQEVFVAPNLGLSIITQCSEGSSTCNATRGPIILPFSYWDDQSSWFWWDVYSPASAGSGRDQVSFAHWYLQFDGIGGGLETQSGHNQPRQIRCDSATYFNRFTVNFPEACIFNEGIPYLTYRALDPAVGEVARHILRAQEDPNNTYPRLVPLGVDPPRDKKIPGKYTGDASDPGLHRIREGVDPEYKANGNEKDAACTATGDYVDLGLPPGDRPIPKEQECDEYPFASTLEGAANPEWDFSVLAVTATVNSTAGQRLGAYYTDDRILSYDPAFGTPGSGNDTFYVRIDTEPLPDR